MKRLLRHAGPAMGFAGRSEVLRATLGMLAGLAALVLFMHPASDGSAFGLFVIAPFGASAVLLFALPNSPLAQPWSAVVGNSVSAMIGVGLVFLPIAQELKIVLAPALAVLVMQLCRALHPPGGAVALTAVLSPDAVQALGLLYVLTPVAIGTLALVPVAALVAKLSGRRYPFRQPAAPHAPGTSDPAAPDRLRASRQELAELLTEFHQSANIGVEDLARLIAAAELLALKHQSDGITCAEIMSRDLVTVGPDTPLTEVAALFRQYGFTSLPVTGPDQHYLGVIFQIHLIRRGQQEAEASGKRFAVAMGHLLGRDPGASVPAQEVMDRNLPHLPPGALLPELLPLLAAGPNDAVPILEGGRIVGIVTRTDLIAALAHQRGSEG